MDHQKQPKINKKYFTIGLYALIVILISIAFNKSVSHLQEVKASFSSFITFVIKTMQPFVLGFALAFLVNPLMHLLEKWIDTFLSWLYTRIHIHKRQSTSKKQSIKKEYKRYISVLFSYVIIIVVLVLLVRYLVPELLLSFESLLMKLQTFLKSIDKQLSSMNENDWLQKSTAFLNEINKILRTDFTLESLYITALTYINTATQFLPSIFSNIIAGTMDMARTLFNVFMGVIISIYMLIDKESLLKTSKKLLYALAPKKYTPAILTVANETNSIFHEFVVGSFIDSLIVGLLFFIVAVAIKAPIPTLLAGIVGITNIIPYFGPWIGGIPVFCIVAIYDIKQAFWVALIILIIQQFDGLVLKPVIFGEKTGLSALAVTFSIFMGGALFGVTGMFFGVPVFAVLTYISKNIINKKITNKYGSTYDTIDTNK